MNRRIAVDQEQAVVDNPDLLFDFIGLIPDIADQLFQNVLHGNDAQRSAVFVGDDGKVLLGIPEQCQDCRQLHGLIDKQRLHQQSPDVDIPVVDGGFEEMVEGKDADDIVDGIFIDRDS